MRLNEKDYLFVYGTLKRGRTNHYLLQDAVFVGEAVTKEKYAMYENVIPYVVKGKRVSPIKGEVYEVSLQTLKKVDLLEGHPRFYKREKVKVVLINSGKELNAWMYFWRNSAPDFFDLVKLNPTGEYLS